MPDEFELVFGLGNTCQVAYQIEKYFGFRLNSPFDWLITPFNSISKIFSDDGEFFGRNIKVEFSGQAAICNHYGIAYHHDYPRDQNSFISITPELMNASRGKMQHKYNKFKELLNQGKKTLFVRLGGHHDSAIGSAYVPDPRTLTTEDLNSLCDAIARKFPDLPFAILLVYIDYVTPVELDATALNPRVFVSTLIDSESPDGGSMYARWDGKPESWKPIFDKFRFSIPNDIERARQFVGAISEQELLLG